MDEHSTDHCSFCGKQRESIEQLIAGQGGVSICNECVKLCSDINEAYRSIAQAAQPARVAKAPQPVGPFRRLKNTLRKLHERQY